MTDKPTISIDSVEMQEYLVAEQLAKVATTTQSDGSEAFDSGKLTRHVRESFRHHRFAIMNWLLLNGVSIPPRLLADPTHPRVGKQFPDQSVRGSRG